MDRFSKSSPSSPNKFRGQFRFKHWYRDNTVYFITARCRGKYPAFRCEQARRTFFDRLEHWATQHHIELWITALMVNHYHLIIYVRTKEELGRFMRKFHGSVAKLVNDLLPERIVPFWVDRGHQDYFDGCLRDEKQLSRSYRYIERQYTRHHLAMDCESSLHVRPNLSLEQCLRNAIERKALMTGIPYRRYQQ